MLLMILLLQVAVIIPYRKRYEQLKIFLRHMHPFLQRQELLYRIIVVEQVYTNCFHIQEKIEIGIG